MLETLDTLVDSALFNYSRVRSLGFTLEYLLLESLSRIVPGGPEVEPMSSDDLIRVREELFALLKADSRNIREGLYPLSVLAPERPHKHLTRIPLILWDGLSLYFRRKAGRTNVFSQRAREFLEGLPRYYQRNFHFQTDGYLSRRSAEIYEHQVELLFAGSADAMRRLILRPLRDRFGNGDGKGLTFVEVGAGTGRATRFVRLAFPKARIVATDLSDPYLKMAQRNLAGLDRVDFLQADGAKLPFQDGHFDAAYSIFLFHELPLEARRDVLRESMRVLKPEGFFGFVDSLQAGDVPELNQSLSRFPKQFHEPYYRNYTESPMEALIQETGFADVRKARGFFSKVCWASKSTA